MGHFAAAYRDKANSRSKAAAAGGLHRDRPRSYNLTLGGPVARLTGRQLGSMLSAG
jgi:hypothetical protein